MKKIISVALLLIATIVTISGCETKTDAEAVETGKVKEVEEVVKKVPIQIMSMKKDTIENTYVSIGEVVPNNQVDLYVKGDGFIEAIHINTGDYVEEDALVIELDDSEVDRTNYNATESQLRTVRDNLGAQLTSLEETFARQETLFEEGLITRIELDQTRDQIDNFQRDYDNAKVAYTNQLTILRNGLKDVEESRMINSSMSGRVAAVYVKEGQAVNNQLAVTVIDDSRLFVKTFVSGDLKKILDVESVVRIRLDGQRGIDQVGKVVELKEIPDMSTKLFEVLIEIPKQESYVIGDYAEVEFVIDRYEAMLVPTNAIIRKGSNQYIYIYEDDKLEQVEIEPGRTSGLWLEAKNLYQLTKVVVRGQNQLTSTSEFVIVE